MVDQLTPQSFKVLVHPVGFRQKGSQVERDETRLLCAWLLETKPNGRPNFVNIDPNQIQDQVFVVEEYPGFNDKYRSNLEKRVWVVKDMRTSWPLRFREFAVAEYNKTLVEEDFDSVDEDSDSVEDIPISRECPAGRTRSSRSDFVSY